MQKKAAIYHFTNHSDIRPIVNQKQLKRLEEFAVSKGFEVSKVYCDYSLRVSERSEFSKLMSDASMYNAIITKDFYHISRRSGMCLDIMKSLRDKNIMIYSLENGYFSWEEAPFSKPLHAASYYSRFGEDDFFRQISKVHNDIIKLFVAKKTNWMLDAQYSDESVSEKDKAKVQLAKLIDDKDKYDILVVNNLSDLNWRTAKLCKIRQELQLDIYSLQDGFLKFTKGELTP